MGTMQRVIQRVIPVSEKDIQCGINDNGFSFRGLLPINAKLNIYQLEVNDNSLETGIISLTGDIVVYVSYTDTDFYSSPLPMRIYLEVDSKTVRAAMVGQDVIPILRDAKRIRAISIVPIDELDEQAETEGGDDNTYRLITKMLIDAGFKTSLRGFSYLRVAIYNALAKKEIWGVLCSEIYPNIADMYKTNARAVEKCIRYAIGLSYAYKQNNNRIPNNAEFISMMVEKIREIWSRKESSI